IQVRRTNRHTESARAAVAIAHHAEGVRVITPPGKERLALRSSRLTHDLMHRRFIVRCGGLESERLWTAREERFPKHGILDQKEEVGGVAPRLCATRDAEPVLQVGPRRPTILAMGIRIPRRKTAGNGAAYRIVNEQALSTRLDKRQRGEPFHRVAWWRLRQ